jgi:hypothetical protein
MVSGTRETPLPSMILEVFLGFVGFLLYLFGDQFLFLTCGGGVLEQIGFGGLHVPLDFPATDRQTVPGGGAGG